MDKLDRTSEVITNKRNQTCRIIAYHNNKNIDVEIIDTKANKIFCLYNQRYQRFKRGELYFLPHLQGDTWRVYQKPPVTEQPDKAQQQQELKSIIAQEAEGVAIAYALGGVLLVAAILTIAAIALLW